MKCHTETSNHWISYESMHWKELNGMFATEASFFTLKCEFVRLCFLAFRWNMWSSATCRLYRECCTDTCRLKECCSLTALRKTRRWEDVIHRECVRNVQCVLLNESNIHLPVYNRVKEAPRLWWTLLCSWGRFVTTLTCSSTLRWSFVSHIPHLRSYFIPVCLSLEFVAPCLTYIFVVYSAGIFLWALGLHWRHCSGVRRTKSLHS